MNKVTPATLPRLERNPTLHEDEYDDEVGQNSIMSGANKTFDFGSRPMSAPAFFKRTSLSASKTVQSTMTVTNDLTGDGESDPKMLVKRKASASHKKFLNSGGEGNRLRSPHVAVNVVSEMDVIEFAAVEYLCYEEDLVCEVTVLRRGPCKARAELKYWNENLTFGSSFLPLEGFVVFAPGERTISLPIKVSIYLWLSSASHSHGIVFIASSCAVQRQRRVQRGKFDGHMPQIRGPNRCPGQVRTR